MANEEQLAILKQGVEVWNKWRDENRDALGGLTEIDLREADLGECNFSKAIFTAGDLREANLNKAILIDKVNRYRTIEAWPNGNSN